MTQANWSPTLWGSSGYVVDPDTDTSHPSGTGGPGKVARGWLVETEPQQWENWVIGRYAAKMNDRVTGGIHRIDDLVTYKANSLVWDVNGKVYHAKASSTGQLTTNTTYWEEAISYSQDAWNGIVNQMATDLTAHTVPNVIKHGETIEQAGGKNATAINNQIAAIRVPLDSHVGAHYPHHETAIQVGTIPSTGGIMLGQIQYASGFALGEYDEVTVSAQDEIAGMGAPNGAAFGVGYPNFRQGGRIQELVTVDSYLTMEASYGQDFALPPADILLPWVSDINPRTCGFGLSFVRGNTLAYTDKSGVAQTAGANVAPFEKLGLKMDINTDMSLTNYPWGIVHQCTVSYHLNGVLKIWHGQFTGKQIQHIFGYTGNIRDVRVWFQYLTDRQISSIPA